MAGRVIRALRMTGYDWTTVQGSSEHGTRAAQHIDVSQARYVTMAVRLHEGTFPANATLKVQAYADGYTSEDPTKVFGTGPVGEVEITSQNTAPFYKTVELDAGLMGAMLTIVVLAEQPGTPGIHGDH